MIRKSFVLLYSAMALCACTPTVEVRGNLPAVDALAQIQIGETTEEQTQLLLGTPSSITNYGQENWHYIYQKIKTVSFFTPREVDYATITVSFDTNGKVNSVTKLGKKDRKSIDLVTRETPSAGREFSIMEQLVGNVGKFTKADKGK
jgi:outer membrane protein assembly factor BamE (lipoprotein component of BamABCDE complex)